jgi:hypothetical protein
MNYDYKFVRYTNYYDAIASMKSENKSGWEVVSVIPEDYFEVTVFYKKVI